MTPQHCHTHSSTLTCLRPVTLRFPAHRLVLVHSVAGARQLGVRVSRYLVESIRKFPDAVSFAEQVQNAGFRFVDYNKLSGGVVAIHSGFKL